MVELDASESIELVGDPKNGSANDVKLWYQ